MLKGKFNRKANFLKSLSSLSNHAKLIYNKWMTNDNITSNTTTSITVDDNNVNICNRLYYLLRYLLADIS